MNKLFWIAAGASLGIGAYIILNGQPDPAYRSSYDSDDLAGGAQEGYDNVTGKLRSGARRVARKTSNWGTEQRVSGTASELGGKLKEGLGNLTGDQDLQGEGVADQAVGAFKDVAGKVAHAASQTIHDLNK